MLGGKHGQLFFDYISRYIIPIFSSKSMLFFFADDKHLSPHYTVNIWFSFRIYNVFVYSSGRLNDVSQ